MNQPQAPATATDPVAAMDRALDDARFFPESLRPGEPDGYRYARGALSSLKRSGFVVLSRGSIVEASELLSLAGKEEIRGGRITRGKALCLVAERLRSIVALVLLALLVSSCAKHHHDSGPGAKHDDRPGGPPPPPMSSGATDWLLGGPPAPPTANA